MRERKMQDGSQGFDSEEGTEEVQQAEAEHISNEAILMDTRSVSKRNTAFICSLSPVS